MSWPVEELRSGTMLSWSANNGMGSVVALSNSSGVVAESYSYDVYGQPTIYDANDSEISESNYDNPYMFTSRRELCLK